MNGIGNKSPKCKGMSIQKNSKKQLLFWYRELIPRIIELVQKNDHNALALIARNCGIPPQLRHVVWPVLLKYHPFVIAPSILSNTLIHDKTEDRWTYEAETRTDAEIHTAILHDLNKYFLNKRNESRVPPPDIIHHVQFLNDIVERFLRKWSRIFKYEMVLVWIAIGLAEWVSIDVGISTEDGEQRGFKYSKIKNSHMTKDSPRNVHVVQRKRHHITIQSLYKEYPLPKELSSMLPKSCFDFYEIYERLVLVILHCPDITHTNIKGDHDNNFPFILGGDILFQTQMFFKIFQLILPELYQPFTDEETLQSSRKADWLYWWFKACGSKVLHKQDRAHLWDILIGWRPHPSCLSFYVGYNNKTFSHFYSTKVDLDSEFIKRVCKDGNDLFWFPDLDALILGSLGLKNDYQVMQELIRRNKYDNNQTKSKDGAYITPHSFDHCLQRGAQEIPFSLIDPHVQLLFIYIAILQQNEFKLLEFEEAEIAEFLSRVPLLSKTDDYNYKILYGDESISISSTDIEDSQNSSSRPSTSSHMLIEVGTDDKIANSFDDISQLAGNIWRKWMWLEFEEQHDII